MSPTLTAENECWADVNGTQSAAIALNCTTLSLATTQPGSCMNSGIHRVISELVAALAQSGNCQLKVFDEELLRFGTAQMLKLAIDGLRIPEGLVGEVASSHRLGDIRRRLNVFNEWTHVHYRRHHPLRLASSALWRSALMVPPHTYRIAGDFQLLHGFFGLLNNKAAVNAEHRLMTVFDAIPALHPHWCEEEIVSHWHEMMRRLNPRTDYIACISASCRDDILAVTGFPGERTAVIHLGVSESFFPRQQTEIDLVRRIYGIPDGPYFLGVGNLEPRKNLEGLVQAMRLISNEPSMPGLVLAGARGWKMERFLTELADDGALASRVRLTGFVLDEHLPALYSGALAFVYPSHYEGFGLPPLEAMACGTPVICSNNSSLPEVVGSAALTVNPGDVTALAAAMRKVAGDAALRERLRALGLERAGRFTWERTTRSYLELYRSIIDGEGVPAHLREPAP